jgi:protein TonB
MSTGRAIRIDGTEVTPELERSNVVPFARRASGAAHAAPEISVDPADRPAGPLVPRRARLAALILCSAAAHAALYLPFAREPEPMASLGEIVISAEIVIGTNTAAGPLDEQGQAQASAPEPARASEPTVDRPHTELAQPEPPKPDVAPTEPPPAVPLVQEQVAALPEPLEPPSVETQPHPPATTAIPAAPPPHANAKALPEQPPPPKEIVKPLPRKPEKPKAETRRASLAGTPNDARSTVPAATSAAGAGRGRSDADSNYAGLVAAHLARFKQFPPDARSRGDQGRATVTFSLSGGGGVTAVRLMRGTGVASLDTEATAMVRRASPFPPPPSGRPVSFTIPVSFRLN